MKRAFLVSILLVSISTASSAQCQPKSLLKVDGVGEIKITPDVVELAVEVQNFDKDRLKAKSTNAARVKAILSIIQSFKVQAGDIQTSRQVVEARYKRDDDTKLPLGFNAMTNIVVKLRDIEQFDEFQEKVLANGATSVSNASFEISDPIPYRAKARAIAIDAAKKKAQAMAKELGQSIGRAFSLTEGSNIGPLGVYSRVYGNLGANVSLEDVSRISLAEGTVSVKEFVTIEFELQ
jgi:uncharacterized protein